MIPHILWSRTTHRPFWAAHERLDVPGDRKLFTDCCCCKIRADEAIARIECVETPVNGDLGNYQYPLDDWQKEDAWLYVGFPPSYEDPRVSIRCASGFGCEANPRKRAGFALRHFSHHGY